MRDTARLLEADRPSPSIGSVDDGGMTEVKQVARPGNVEKPRSHEREYFEDGGPSRT